MKKLLLVLLLVILLLTTQGCFSGTGFEKKATLMPDSVMISIGEQRYDSTPAWWGINVGAQWNLE